jgi:hypothetical protein
MSLAVIGAGVMSHGLSCEVCKYKVHKRCAAKAISNCKWTTLASVGKEIIEDKDGVCTFMSGYRLIVCVKDMLNLFILVNWLKLQNDKVSELAHGNMPISISALQIEFKICFL